MFIYLGLWFYSSAHGCRAISFSFFLFYFKLSNMSDDKLSVPQSEKSVQIFLLP